MFLDIPSPEEFFGFKMGADQKLARWDKIVEYFWLLDRSPCVKVTELGRSTEGNPFLISIISSPENIENVEKIREMSYRIAHPKGLTEAEVERIIREGKTVVAIGLGIHADEVGPTQMASELAYELATIEDPGIQEIRENTVLLLIPCLNPDGQLRVTDWYNKWLGTEFEGCGLPCLYDKYTGQDCNRDGFHIQLVESQMLARILYREWYPQAYVDLHTMGSYGARFYIPPLGNPIDPNVDPLIWIEQQLYGSMMSVMLEQAGKTGVESAVTFSGQVFSGWCYVPCWHNICAMLMESASVKVASPIYVHHHQLMPSFRGRPEYRVQREFPHPWPGGWWRLRDIVEQQKIASLATLKVAATFREMLLRNMYLKATRSIEAGLKEPPYAFIVKSSQHDELTAYKFLRMMSRSGVEISRSKRMFTADGVTYPKGTFIIFTSQVSRPYLLALLRRTFYYDGPFARRPDGTPIPPGDSATNTVAEFMGVDLQEVKEPLEGAFEKLNSIPFPRGSVEENKVGYLLEGALNESYAAVNRLIQKGVEVHRVLEPVKSGNRTFETGSFFIHANEGLDEDLKRLSKQHHLLFAAAPSSDFEKRPVRILRIGMYQRYRGGNIDEGWTRFLLEQYKFEYKTLKDEDIKKGNLRDKYDVIVLPSDHKSLILGEGIVKDYQTMPEMDWYSLTDREETAKDFYGEDIYVKPDFPPEYRSGIGKEGVEKLREFVETGGTLVTLGEASNFAIEELKLPVKNVLADLKPKEFYCPGSTLRVNVDRGSTLSYGVSDVLLIYFRNHPAFEVKTGKSSEDIRIVVSYPDERIMQSGWLIGEKHLSRKAALIDAKLGEGRVVLFGFSPQFRAQTDATFKFFFNCLLG